MSFRREFLFSLSPNIDGATLSGLGSLSWSVVFDSQPETGVSPAEPKQVRPLHINLRAEDLPRQVIDDEEMMAFTEFLVLTDLVVNLPVKERHQIHPHNLFN